MRIFGQTNFWKKMKERVNLFAKNFIFLPYPYTIDFHYVLNMCAVAHNPIGVAM